jgi:hypothetical protein
VTPQDQAVDVLDHGFTAFGCHRPESGITFGEFLVNYGICPAESLQGTKTPCLPDFPEPECSPTSIYNEPEDRDELQSLNSLCACLDGLRVADLCESCEVEHIFISASSQDYCLKQMSESAYYRELCNNPSATGSNGDCYTSTTSTYIRSGYISRIRIGPLQFGDPTIEKLLTGLLIEAYPEPSNSPAFLHVSTGTNYQAVDANLENSSTCGPLWEAHEPIEFTCLNGLTGLQMIAQNLRPDEAFEWAIYERGRFHYIDVMIAGENRQAITGGAGTLSRMEVSVKTIGSCK